MHDATHSKNPSARSGIRNRRDRVTGTLYPPSAKSKKIRLPGENDLPDDEKTNGRARNKILVPRPEGSLPRPFQRRAPTAPSLAQDLSRVDAVYSAKLTVDSTSKGQLWLIACRVIPPTSSEKEFPWHTDWQGGETRGAGHTLTAAAWGSTPAFSRMGHSAATGLTSTTAP